MQPLQCSLGVIYLLLHLPLLEPLLRSEVGVKTPWRPPPPHWEIAQLSADCHTLNSWLTTTHFNTVATHQLDIYCTRSAWPTAAGSGWLLRCMVEKKCCLSPVHYHQQQHLLFLRHLAGVAA